MLKKKLKLRKVIFTPSHSLPILAVIVGLLMALFLDEVAIRLIGVAVAILAGIGLSMMVYDKLRYQIEITRTPTTVPIFTVVENVTQGSTSQVFENFEQVSNQSDKDIPQQPQQEAPPKDLSVITKTEPKDNKPKVFESPTGETFTIIPKKNKTTDELNIKPQSAPTNEQKPAPIELVEEDSEVRFIGTVKPSKPDTSNKEHVGIPKVTNDKQKNDNQGKPAEPLPQSFDSGTLFGTAETTTTVDKDGKNINIRTIDDINLAQAQQSDSGSDFSNASEVIKKKYIDVNLSEIIEIESVSGEEPRKEFEFFLIRVLKIIRSITNTRTASFLLVNSEKKELILQAFDTDVPQLITPKFKIPIRNDIISRIANSAKPEILTEINPSSETDLIPYYTRPVGIMSFIGVPVFYNRSVAGILCADSAVADAYNAFTVSFLGHFTKLIGSLVITYTEKYELLQAKRTLIALNTFRSLVALQNASLNDLYTAVAEASAGIFDYPVLGICGYDQQREIWILSSIISKDERETSFVGKEIKLEGTLAGQAVQTGKNVFISQLFEEQIMYNSKEFKYPGGFFASVPLKSMTNTYGALFVVGKSKANITTFDLKILETLGENAGSYIEHYLFLNMLQSSSMVDSGGILNPGAFMQRMEEEYLKAADAAVPFILCLFKIDISSAYNHEKYPERTDKIYLHVINVVKKYLKAYHPFGKFDNDTFGVILTATRVFEAKQWAERLRSDIAKTPVEVANKRYYVTISLGLAEAAKNESFETLIGNTNTALKVSTDKTNKVTIFE